MSIQDYLIDQGGIDWAFVLKPWAGLLPATSVVWMVNRFGDVFLEFADGSIHLLDLGGSEVSRLANDRDELAVDLDDEDKANNWFMIPLVDELVASGMMLQAGQCYGYKQPPVLGGDYTAGNVCIVPVLEHFAFYGYLYNQIKDLPDGTEVVLNRGVPKA